MTLRPMCGAFLVGLGYLGMQTLFLGKMVLICAHPQTALFVHLYLLLITILIAVYIIDSRPATSAEHWLRAAGLGVLVAHGLAYFLLRWIESRAFTSLTGTWLGALLLTPPAVTAGLAFGWFFQVVAKTHSRSIALIICSVIAGALVAVTRAHMLILKLGSPLAFGLLLGAMVITLAIWPAPASEDRHPSPW